MDLGFSRSARLTKSVEFTRVLNSPRALVWRHQNEHFRILSIEAPQPRLGLAIAKRLMPKAVDRNRVRRLIRESFRHHHEALPPRDYVVFARQPLGAYSKTTIRQGLDGLMHAIMTEPTD